MKNPLNAMMIHLELLRNKLHRLAQSRPAPALAGSNGGPEPAIRARARGDEPRREIIADEIRRLDQVVQGFLKFARPGEMKLEPVDVDVLLAEVARMVGPQAQATRVDFRVDVMPGLPPINGDSTMLGQALMNLSLNAVQAMPEGGALSWARRTAGGAA